MLNQKKIDELVRKHSIDYVLRKLEEKQYLFHGSDNGDIKVFEPRPSEDMARGKEPPAVYATGDSAFALFRAFTRWRYYSKFGYGSDTGYVFEMTPGNRKRILKKNELGYIYIFKRGDFKKRFKDKENLEFVSTKYVKPIAVIPIRGRQLFEIFDKRGLKIDYVRFGPIKERIRMWRKR
jgi:hypothetical protein